MTTTPLAPAPIKPAKTPKVGIVSLGCPKALVDSERIITRLRAEGYQIAPDYAGADLVLVNTCGFLDSARDESLAAIGEAIEANGKVIVTGCLGAEPEVIQRAHPKVLAVTGPHQYEAVMNAVHTHLTPPHNPHLDLVPESGLRLTPRHYAYLKISEGCNNRCSFCIIPKLRGDLASRPIHHVLTEAEKLVAAGVKELLVISQDTSAYGLDVRYKPETWRGTEYETRFLDLARGLGSLGVWTRMHYVYPYPHVDNIIPLMAEGLITPYLDIPFQHASAPVLKAMKRPGNQDKVLARIAKWRADVPDLAIRSTFIVGFPGETEEDFEILLDFIREAKIDRAGCFRYENVVHAESGKLDHHVPEEVKEERWHRFMEAQAEVSAERAAAQVGRKLDIIIDGEDDQSPGGWIGRSKADAPEVDAVVYVTSKRPLRLGDIVRTRITGADDYDLYGETI
ncbi:MAG: 30S ribosomal protein S12 methylthiotransferase RimO [Hyphomonas sp.]|uniref:30S ribosomal protein S12 methylthiotransferase RimO n=1 Tax=Hyphomonas sp. TaxID=87 RepID=UPI0017AC3D8C|nr:30S ribosomal protein S12 methylthiotransferase RimO [Hyphomonas sp.]MBA3069835.1 30S ribosomal protein S12 methylthiotransferase RimO [Hyphomonas sp.]MBU3922161.1 30S ribosomal protein S12 methylthiotransferase RimO [Alphaproteobacteria bacterium]MBU4062676.1 30S ribosomal protein S12 methylthiotransferase RimO [Alphaproteobacteria bacterium]MBU4164027.1 30S ribosomal protein S12 methylthiotransferase RimO [Alphaproteobacteria bacterium]